MHGAPRRTKRSIPPPPRRRASVAVLATLAAAASGLSAAAAGSPAPPPGTLVGGAAFGDYRKDAPGVRRRILSTLLPPPFATKSATHGPRVVPPPDGARPLLPPGFTMQRLPYAMGSARTLRTAPNGDVFVADTGAGKLRVLRLGEASAPADDVFATGLREPFGMAFFPPGPDPRWLYVASSNDVVRFPYRRGDRKARGPAETIVPRLTPTSGGHSSRDLAFSRDGRRLYVSVGSASNVAEGAAPVPGGDLRAWEKARGVGATWGDEEGRAAVHVYDANGTNGRLFASGIRNCSGLAVSPATDAVWCTCNERDGLGDDLVPDYVTRVKDGATYGWPWYYLGPHEDPRHVGARPDLAGSITVPDVLIQAHSAPLQIVFYDGNAFPPEYRGDAFVTLHGSWNHSTRAGYKIVRIIMKNGAPTGEYEDFVTGFVQNDDEVWARPVGLTVAGDGALLMLDDGNGTLWRISYGAPAAGADAGRRPH